jgi:hypothetical protein
VARRGCDTTAGAPVAEVDGAGAERPRLGQLQVEPSGAAQSISPPGPAVKPSSDTLIE